MNQSDLDKLRAKQQLLNKALYVMVRARGGAVNLNRSLVESVPLDAGMNLRIHDDNCITVTALTSGEMEEQ